MNKDDKDIEALAAAWTVETMDLTARIAAATQGATVRSAEFRVPSSTLQAPIAEALLGEILAEIRGLRTEVDALRQTNLLLQDEVFRLRVDLNARRVIRLAPFSPSDSLVRLS